jgi:UDP-N-acetylmuramoyl-tripeptide--D-alanyl-D-alanine ligase
MLFSIKDLFEATEWVVLPEKPINGLKHDHRQIVKKDTFIALSGQNTHGASYVEKAYENGAGWTIHPHLFSDMPGAVLDTNKTLWDLAHYAKNRCNGYFIGITGTAGKTTIKSALANLIEGSYSSKKNFNNYVGLPISCIHIPRETKVVILETGINKINEMDQMADLIKPDLGIMTSVGPGHLSGLSSVDTVISEKYKLINASKKAIVPDTVTAEYGNISTFGLRENATYRCIDSRYEDSLTRVWIEHNHKIETFCIPWIGDHAGNIAACLYGIINMLDIKFDEEKIREIDIEHGRGKRHKLKKYTVLDESYNANPVSMRAAISSLKCIGKAGSMRTVAVLGDMKELGINANIYHENLIEKLHGIDLVLLCGPLMRELAGKHRSMIWAENSEQLIPHIEKLVSEGDVVMVKGSRSMEMEKIVDLLINNS